MERMTSLATTLLVATLSGILFGLICLIPVSHTIDVGGYDSAYVQGFFDQEPIPSQFATDGMARWSGADAAVILPQFATPMHVRMRVVAPHPQTVTITANGGNPVLQQWVDTSWHELSFEVPGGEFKPFTLYVALQSDIKPWQTGDPRQVGILVDSITITTLPPNLPYPWPIAWVILCSMLCSAILQSRQLPNWQQRCIAILVPVGAAIVSWRGQFWFPLPQGVAIVCGLCALMLAVRYQQRITRRIPWWGDALSGITIAVWSTSNVFMQRMHLTLAVPGVEKDFRSFASRSDSLTTVFTADPFYNYGYPFILHVIQQLSGASAFDSARWWGVIVATGALIATWWLARFIFGQYWGAFMTITVATSALFTQYALSLGSDMTFSALTTLACALLVRTPARPRWMIGVGVMAGLAFTVRHTGIILIAVIILWTIVQRHNASSIFRQLLWLGVGWLIGAGAQLGINYSDTGQILFSHQAKNSWLAVYGNLDWGRWGDVPDTIPMRDVILNDPVRFTRAWWYNITAIWGSSTAADERAIFQRLLSFPANWLSVAGIVLLIQWWWRFGMPRTHQLASIWLVGFLSVSALAFVLPRFLLPLIWVAAFTATWLMIRIIRALPAPWRIWVLLAVVCIQSAGVMQGHATVIASQPRDEYAVLAHVSRTYPHARIAFVAGRESPIGKYSALADARTFRTITAPVNLSALCDTQPDLIIWSRELQPLPTDVVPLWHEARYAVFHGDMCATLP